MEDITINLKSFIRSIGADIVGVAPVSRFDDYPIGHRPPDLLQNAQSAIAFGIRILESHIDWDRLFKNSEFIPESARKLVSAHHFYMRTSYEVINARLEQIAMDTARWLEDLGYDSMYFPATYAHHAPIMEKVKYFMSPFPHRGAAVRAGLGEFGYNNLFLSERFGPRIRINSVITSAELKPDEILKHPICLRDKCLLCVKKCSANCITPKEDSDRDKIFINPPSNIDVEKCYTSHGDKDLCPGLCIRICPIGRKRKSP